MTLAFVLICAVGITVSSRPPPGSWPALMVVVANMLEATIAAALVVRAIVGGKRLIIR
jgi:hypothetical protein